MKNWGLSLILAVFLLLAPTMATAAGAESDTVQDTTLEPGITTSSDNTSDNTTDNATQTKSWWLRLRGVPGKGILTAPGLQKPFNPNWKGFKAIEKTLKLRTQEQTSVTEQTQNQGEERGLNVRERSREEIQLQQYTGTTQQMQNHGPGGPKGKGKKGQH
jgi:hypothetical protein